MNISEEENSLENTSLESSTINEIALTKVKKKN